MDTLPTHLKRVCVGPPRRRKRERQNASHKNTRALHTRAPEWLYASHIDLKSSLLIIRSECEKNMDYQAVKFTLKAYITLDSTSSARWDKACTCYKSNQLGFTSLIIQLITVTNYCPQKMTEAFVKRDLLLMNNLKFHECSIQS